MIVSKSDKELLPATPYGRWRRSVLDDDVADDGNRTPRRRVVRGDAVGSHNRELFAEQADLGDVGGNLYGNRLGADRADGLHTTRAGAAADTLYEIVKLAELPGDSRPREQRVVERQDADGRGVGRESAIRPHFLF